MTKSMWIKQNKKGIESHSIEDKEKILKYRKRFKLPHNNFSDEQVLEFINSIRWLAKLYIQEFKSKSPESILKENELSYNEDTDNHKYQ